MTKSTPHRYIIILLPVTGHPTGYKAKDWLGFLIAGKKYITVSEEGGVEEGCEQLLTEINSILNKTGTPITPLSKL